MLPSKSTDLRHKIRREDINTLAQSIGKKYKPEKIILFGSYAKGNPDPSSDVDILIIVDTDQSPRQISVEISCSFKHTFPVDIIVRTPQQITKRLQSGVFFMKEVVDNGKVLYERTGQWMAADKEMAKQAVDEMKKLRKVIGDHFKLD